MAIRKYLPEVMPALARAKMRAGWSREQLANYLRVHPRTLLQWELLYPAFRDALGEANVSATAEVEARLLRATQACRYTEVVVEIAGATKKRKIYHRKARPNITAMTFWLKHREASRWGGQASEETEEEPGMDNWSQVQAALQAAREKYGHGK